MNNNLNEDQNANSSNILNDQKNGQISIFEHPEFGKIRIVIIGNEPWFVAKDVTESLGYKWHHNLLAHIPSEWKGGRSITTPGGNQQVSVLSESGLYFFLNRSDKPGAIPFQKWLAGEVLPSIRKTGSYTTQKAPTVASQLLAHAQWMVECEERLNSIENKLTVLEAKDVTRPDYFTVVGYCTLHRIQINLHDAAKLGKDASSICRAKGFMIDKIPDPRFGTVGMYPRSVLDEVFSRYFNND